MREMVSLLRIVELFVDLVARIRPWFGRKQTRAPNPEYTTVYQACLATVRSSLVRASASRAVTYNKQRTS